MSLSADGKGMRSCCVWGQQWGSGQEWGRDTGGMELRVGWGGSQPPLTPVSPQTYGSGMRPPPSSLAGPGMPAMNM